ncbi:uncharacterized protein LOC119648125 isoform X3 [Hermetia illucens]|uniref:uncharacterized protein LOC119648125 isoform X3 n=1 Tax=Hermetia illucens TaxID=343691 RepID=UPI0018CC6EFA|nr:uncharacterized protein LOC119648125 isoform X3 [Hermetia illucens]
MYGTTETPEDLRTYLRAASASVAGSQSSDDHNSDSEPEEINQREQPIVEQQNRRRKKEFKPESWRKNASNRLRNQAKSYKNTHGVIVPEKRI